MWIRGSYRRVWVLLELAIGIAVADFSAWGSVEPIPAKPACALRVAAVAEGPAWTLGRFPPAIAEIFRQMNAAKSRSFYHPDKLSPTEVDQLARGDIVYLDVESAQLLSLPPWVPRSLRFEVRQSLGEPLRLYNVILGEFRFDKKAVGELYGNLYRRKKFWLRAPFVPGEFVQLGSAGPQRATEDLKLIHRETGATEWIDKDALPWIAKFIRALSPQEYEVEFPGARGGPPRRFRVARSAVSPLHIGSGKVLRAVLAPLKAIQPRFWLGEKVRVRDNRGLMRLGQIVGLKDASVLVADEGGTRWIPRDKVFKWRSSGKVASVKVDTARYFADGRATINLEAPTGLVTEVLDGAARLASHPDFLAASRQVQLAILVAYENILLPWHRAGGTLEQTGIFNFSQVLCSGAVRCRHNVPFLAGILSEAGRRVFVYYRMMSEEEFRARGGRDRGHTWLLDAPISQAEEPFVIDPNYAVVKPWKEALTTAAAQPGSHDGLWWTHPGRRSLEIVPLK